MRPVFSSLAFVGITFTLAATSVGCAAPTSDGADGVASATSEDPRDALATNAKAITLLENGKTATIGAPNKLASAMKAIEGTLASVGGVPRCPPAFTLTYLDAKSMPLATLARCGQDKGYLKIGAKVFEVPVADAALHATFAAETAVGDILWGVDEMVSAENEQPGAEPSQRDPLTIALWSKAFDHDDVPKSLPVAPSAEQLQSFTFRRAGKDAAKITVYAPDDDKAMDAPATISVDGKLVGWTTFSLEAIFGGGF